MWTWVFVLTRIFSNPLSNVFQKKLTSRSADPLFIVFATHLLLSLVCLPVLLTIQPGELGADFWGYMLVCAFLAIAGNTLIVAALKTADLSVLGPINSYKAIVSLLPGALLLGEFPTLPGGVGILLILLGSYFIAEPSPTGSRPFFFRLPWAERGVQLRLAALLFSATEAIFLKKALLLSSPLTAFAGWCWLGALVAGLMLLPRLKKDFTVEVATWRQNQPLYWLLALTTGLMQVSTLFTFGYLQVGYSLALFQTSTLLSVWFGYRFFREKNIARRLLGAGIMVVGAMMIVTFGAQEAPLSVW